MLYTTYHYVLDLI